MEAATKPKGKGKKKAEDQDEGRVIELVVDNVECRIDIDALDYGEMAIAEEIMGRPWWGTPYEALNSAKGTITVAYLARRRVDPFFTREDAERLKPGQIKVVGDRPTETPDDAGSES